jgi:hypothetical protein
VASKGQLMKTFFAYARRVDKTAQPARSLDDRED